MIFPSIITWSLTLAIIGHANLTQATAIPTTNTTLSLLTPNSTTSRRLLYPAFGRDDYTTSGTYQILLCGAHQLHSNAAKLELLLPLIRQILLRVIRDIQTPSSPFGYGAFFKTDANRAAVTDVFQKMVNGAAVRVSADRATRLGSLTAPPTFACMEEGDSFTAQMLARCEAEDHGTRFSPLMTWGATEIIIICPSFWRLPAGLYHGSCPRVVDNQMVPNNEALIRSMYGVIVRALAHVYVPESVKYDKTVDFVQDVIELNETASLVNANNYALYAGSFQARCTHWPTVSQCETDGSCVWPPPFKHQ